MDFRVFNDSINDHLKVVGALIELEPLVREVGIRCIEAIKAGNKIIFCGNGGSAADSQHLSAELTGMFLQQRRPLAATSLTVNTSSITAVANDFGYDQVFSRELQAIGKPGDIFIGISTSGNSKNVLFAIESAKIIGITTIGLTGQSGGAMVDQCDFCIRVPSKLTPRIQEAHILIGHILCHVIESELC